MVEDVTSPRPSRHPKSGMSSSARHSASSIAFISQMGVSTRGISLGSPHSSVRLHTSVWAKSPRFDGIQLTVVRTLRAFLRGGGRHLSQTFSTPHDRYCMSSSARHSASSIAFISLMGVSTRGISLGSPHSSVRLHTSVWAKSPRFDGVQLTVVSSLKASVLQQELYALLLKGEIEEVPQSDIKQGFSSCYFLIPKRDGGLRPILNLRLLNLSLYKGKFKMLTLKTIMSQI